MNVGRLLGEAITAPSAVSIEVIVLIATKGALATDAINARTNGWNFLINYDIIRRCRLVVLKEVAVRVMGFVSDDLYDVRYFYYDLNDLLPSI